LADFFREAENLIILEYFINLAQKVFALGGPLERYTVVKFPLSPKENIASNPQTEGNV
jgi:hypothetical protein